MDYYGVYKNSQGYTQILGIIDLATNALTLIALKHRTAAATAHTILYEIVVRKGCPKLIHSDAAQEFISKAMKSLTPSLDVLKPQPKDTIRKPTLQ
jgi:hypothetical protein